MGGGTGRRFAGAATSGPPTGVRRPQPTGPPDLRPATNPASTASAPSRSPRCWRSTTIVCGGGFLGVSTFFTLSGFLITGLILRRARCGAAASRLRGFFGRRIRRLFPAAVAGLVLAAAVVAWCCTTRRRRRTSPSTRSAALGDVANWRFLASGQSYVESVRDAVAAAALLVARGRGAVLSRARAAHRGTARASRAAGGPRSFAALDGARGASFVDGWISAAHGVDRAYYGTDTRAVEFLVGALLAVAIAGRPLRRGASRAVAIAGPFALAGLVWANGHAPTSVTGPLPRWSRRVRAARLRAPARRVPARADPGGLLDPAAARARPHQLRRVRVPLAGLPLAHGRRAPGSGPYPLTALRFASTVGVAVVSFHLLEQPIRERRVLAEPAVGSRSPLPVRARWASPLSSARSPRRPRSRSPRPQSPSSVLAASQRALSLPPPTGRTTSTAAATQPCPPGHGRRRLRRAHARARHRTLGSSPRRLRLQRRRAGLSPARRRRRARLLGRHVPAARPLRDPRDWPKVLAEFRPDVVVVLYGAWDVYDASFDQRSHLDGTRRAGVGRVLPAAGRRRGRRG